MNDSQRDRLRFIPPKYRSLFEKAYSGKRKALSIRCKCLDCTCYQRKEITNCTVLACPLWPYRPYQASRTMPEGTVE